ncbi:hypothetical protein J2X11_000003 [Aeromicrobium panaciterrae]|uniref:DUF4064 domain-containing protein n=1 Tax=Aeromicrobium panaciterrae TaxID=363861 RepID=A0ABU1UJ03_9ACTN|nr:hypothetical protein [Aeromicrobium panaciterrae]MDR7085164.1 hypothetical protein [Aeromicrobium panaciterrae]
MSELRRPPSVTMACIFIGLTSLIVFGSVTSALSNWGSIELQDGVRDVLDDPAFDGVDLTVSQAIEWLRRAAYAVVVLTIAGVVFAVFTTRGDRISRVSLTVMCGLAFVGFIGIGGLAGMLPAVLAVVCATQLWSPDSRAWFDAKNGVVRPAVPPVPGSPIAGPVAAPAVPLEQPKSVRIAGLVALIASWLVLMFSVYYALIYVTARDSYVDSLSKGSTKKMLDEYGIAPSDFVTWMFIFFVVCGVLAVLACTAAALMLRGVPRARTATIVLAAVSVPVSFVFVGVGWPWTAAAVFVLVQLRRRQPQGA